MKPTMDWTRMTQLTPGTSYTSVKPRTLRVYEPGSTTKVYGVVSASVERNSSPGAGTYYHLQVLSYRLTAEGIVDLNTQRVVESGLETTLSRARVRAEQAVRRGMSELWAAARQQEVPA